ncbi:efflux RND transporter periplasmic adaptor subunit [Acidocella aromatica]|uniref:Multidrug resistance efflux pump n=1 Tax=Acidocella aromatica TaxID=1303579 RepID=A0A840VG15_9PROT|nr:HlyD family secretion protein [Acidocella aromatica]MBB5372155.1 multidrug resistance efflux pump [Acidocella aromatica]
MMISESFRKTFFSALLLAVALLALYALWVRYEVEPTTRDGKVKADIVQVSPDVSGWVTDVLVRDNEAVKKGDVLLVIDQSRYQLARDEAEENLETQQTSLAQAIREDNRNHALSAEVDTETMERGTEKVELLKLAVAQAKTALGVAQLNLDRTVLRAPVNGIVSNMTLQPGDYLTAGHGVMAMVDTDSLRVEGYFEETKIPAVHVGDKAQVRLMGVADPIEGHVESIAAGVVDREREDAPNTLDNVNPSFTWVRLAQRIPVRIAIDHVPDNLPLIVGTTATIDIKPRSGEPSVHRSWPW